MKDTNTKLYIFSCNDSWESIRLNVLAHEDTLSILKSKGLEPSEINHVFDNKSEFEIALQLDKSQEDVVKDMAKRNRQGSFVMVNSDRTVEVFSLDKNEFTFVGKWTEVDREEAESKKEFYLINNTYYMVNK